MIKYFRKIRKKMLSENKFSKYLIYALGEILLVVIGILIALKINNWNQNRIERNKESNYIENINKEFLLNKRQLDSVTFYHHKVYINATKILNLMPIDIETVNKDSLSFYISETFYHHTFNPQQTSVNSLTNTSSFEIISNLELRELLQKWDEFVSDYQEEELLFKEYSFDNYVPYMTKYFSVAALMKDENVLNLPNAKYIPLNSLEFENAIALRINLLRDVIFGSELKEINRTMNRIIELTASK